MERTKTYRELDVIPMPEPIPELGIEAGHPATVVRVLETGQAAEVEIVEDGGRVIATADLALRPELHVLAYEDERD